MYFFIEFYIFLFVFFSSISLAKIPSQYERLQCIESKKNINLKQQFPDFYLNNPKDQLYSNLCNFYSYSSALDALLVRNKIVDRSFRGLMPQELACGYLSCQSYSSDALVRHNRSISEHVDFSSGVSESDYLCWLNSKDGQSHLKKVSEYTSKKNLASLQKLNHVSDQINSEISAYKNKNLLQRIFRKRSERTPGESKVHHYKNLVTQLPGNKLNIPSVKSRRLIFRDLEVNELFKKLKLYKKQYTKILTSQIANFNELSIFREKYYLTSMNGKSLASSEGIILYKKYKKAVDEQLNAVEVFNAYKVLVDFEKKKIKQLESRSGILPSGYFALISKEINKVKHVKLFSKHSQVVNSLNKLLTCSGPSFERAKMVKLLNNSLCMGFPMLLSGSTTFLKAANELSEGQAFFDHSIFQQENLKIGGHIAILYGRRLDENGKFIYLLKNDSKLNGTGDKVKDYTYEIHEDQLCSIFSATFLGTKEETDHFGKILDVIN